MTDTPNAGNVEPDVSPTQPLPYPPVAETAPTAEQAGVAPAPYAPAPYQPAPQPHTHLEPAAIAAIVVGALLVVVLSFGAGWSARGTASRFGAMHGFGPSAWGQDFNGMHGNLDGRGMMPGPNGYGQRGQRGYGRGMMPGQQDQGYGQQYRQGPDNGSRRGMMGRRWGQNPSQTPTQTAPPAPWQ